MSTPSIHERMLAFVFYRCVVGSTAYGLAGPDSDLDIRGLYAPPAALVWGLHPPPEQLEPGEGDVVYWEVGKFCRLALKCNPSLLEALYTDHVLQTSPLAEELRALRGCFLSRAAINSYGGFARSGWARVLRRHQGDGPQSLLDARDAKLVHHVFRLLQCGAHLLVHGEVLVDVGPWRAELRAVKRGVIPWGELGRVHADLEALFAAAAETTALPHNPQRERVERFLDRARRVTLEAHPDDGA